MFAKDYNTETETGLLAVPFLEGLEELDLGGIGCC